MIFSCLSPVDLANFSLTCRTAYNSVKAFSRLAYDIRKLLSRYFPEDQIDAFRYLQDRTRTLISGSTALQFFDRTYYEGSDLDLYVEERHAKEVLYFIRDKGYVFDPRDGQPKDLDDAIDYAADDPYRHQDGPEYAELVNAISAVFNFSQNGKKVQVITSRWTDSPLSIVLSFHSSVLPFLFGSVFDAHLSYLLACVMQVISARHAISLYPLATFGQRQSLIMDTGRDIEAPLQKYAKRGWSIMGESDCRRAGLRYRWSQNGCFRRVGDRFLLDHPTRSSIYR